MSNTTWIPIACSGVGKHSTNIMADSLTLKIEKAKEMRSNWIVRGARNWFEMIVRRTDSAQPSASL
jgi:hypothetical protein